MIWGRRLYCPPKVVVLRIFIDQKIRRPLPGLNSRTLDSDKHDNHYATESDMF
jgi:hypothetical protein